MLTRTRRGGTSLADTLAKALVGHGEGEILYSGRDALRTMYIDSVSEREGHMIAEARWLITKEKMGLGGRVLIEWTLAVWPLTLDS